MFKNNLKYEHSGLGFVWCCCKDWEYYDLWRLCKLVRQLKDMRTRTKSSKEQSSLIVGAVNQEARVIVEEHFASNHFFCLSLPSDSSLANTRLYVNTLRKTLVVWVSDMIIQWMMMWPVLKCFVFPLLIQLRPESTALLLNARPVTCKTGLKRVVCPPH